MIDILTALNNLGYANLKDFGSHWRTMPIYRASDNPTALAIKKSTGEWFDFVEGHGGKFEDLILRTLNLPSGTNIKDVIPDLPTFSLQHTVELSEVKKFDRAYLGKLLKDNSYWNGRGISDKVLSPLLGGIAPTPGRMQNRYVFPIFDGKEIIGFTGRTLCNITPKWKHLGAKSNWIWPHTSLPFIQDSQEVDLVESPGDAVSLLEVNCQNVLTLFGVSLSAKIICLLLKLGVKKINIILNNDCNNGFVGNKEAVKVKRQLCAHFDDNQINIITPPVNDLNEMLTTSRAEFMAYCKETGI